MIITTPTSLPNWTVNLPPTISFGPNIAPTAWTVNLPPTIVFKGA